MIDVHPLRDAVSVMVEETRYLVEREDLIPIEEWEALKAKAETPCSKSDDEPCECGARGGQKAAIEDEEEVSEPVKAASASDAPGDTGDTADAQARSESRRRGRRHARRGRPRRNKRNQPE